MYHSLEFIHITVVAALHRHLSLSLDILGPPFSVGISRNGFSEHGGKSSTFGLEIYHVLLIGRLKNSHVLLILGDFPSQNHPENIPDGS